MLDAKVISAILDSREAYEKVSEHLDPEEMSLQAQTWLPLIQGWYRTDKSAKAVDRDVLVEQGKLKLPEAHLDSLVGWFQNLPEVQGPEAVVGYVLDLKRYVKGNELCAAIQGRNDNRIDALAEEYVDLRKAIQLGSSEIVWTMDDSEMDEQLDRGNLIKIGPKRLLEKRLKGGFAPGDTMLVFGRPEAGKTLFTCNAVAGALRHGHTVFYGGNEESTYKTRKRIINSLTGTTRDDYEEDKTRVLDLAYERGLDNLHICHMEPGTIPEIEDLVKDCNPDMVVIDQIRNVDLKVKSGNFAEQLGQLGTAMRNMANRHKFFSLSVTQAGDKTERHGQEPPAIMTMSDIADNRTSLVGQFDVICAVGCTEELRRKNERVLSLCKNKLNEDPEGHEPLNVRVDPRRSTVR